ncbi:MAG TPA: hypothetical protein VJS15_04795 [Allosphingosinicella sp.]|nr:hypothetical protein [Allosphingosinicella sp.]
MAWRPMLCAVLALAACRPADEQGATPADVPQADAAAERDRGPPPDLNASVALDQLEGIDNHLPPPLGAGPPRFVGRWAAEEALCARAAWRFTERGLHTPAGSACRFERIEEVPGGYSIAARCTAEGPERADRLEIRFAESAQAMLFDSQSVAAAGLVRCPGAD